MAKSDLIELEGIVTNKFPNSFEVTVNQGEKEMKITGRLSGRLRQNHIKVIIGDTVTIGVSPYDLTNGIITWRGKK